MVLGHSRGRVSPRHVRGLTKRKGKNGIGATWKKSKNISVNREGYAGKCKRPGKAALTAIQYSVPDRTILPSFYNHPQPLWIWADGTSISPEKVDPTRGRRIRNIY